MKTMQSMKKPASAKRPTGFIVYRGPSLINGEPIVVVAITKSKNEKTGNMVQTHILPDNGLSPMDNSKALKDESVCGNCKHRRGLGGSCYVDLSKGPRAVFGGVERGIYPMDLESASKACEGRMVRLGSYGDPAAVPVRIWNALLFSAKGHTGYTHQWMARDLATPELMRIVMASADSLWERQEAKRRGFRTFRVRDSSEELDTKEFLCPASQEAGKRKECSTCGACNGGYQSTKADPVIIVHGSLKSRFISIKAI